MELAASGRPGWIIVNDLCGRKELLEGVACLLSCSVQSLIAAKEHHVRLHAWLQLHAGLKEAAPERVC